MVHDDRESVLFNFLATVNGQDFYREAAGRKLSASHYMKLPEDVKLSNTLPCHVGTTEAATQITDLQKAQIYALNKDVFEGEENQIKGALLRLELFLAGWCTNHYEVSFVRPPLFSVDTMHADLPRIRTYIADAKVLAYLLPLATEHTFRTMGHHFLSSRSAEYTAKYQKFFDACLFPTIANYMPADLLYHRAAHWVPLNLALAVAKDPLQAERLPNAVVIRARSAPVGTALVTTSAAILEAIEGRGLRRALDEHSEVDSQALMDMADKVKSNPAAYHTITSAYGKPALSATMSDELNKQKSAAKKLAPVLQGFLDSLPSNSYLTLAKVIQKHSDVDPILRDRAKVSFSQVGKSAVYLLKKAFHR